MITLKINNRVVRVEEGSTILQAAKQAGIFIPTFCFDELERMPAAIVQSTETAKSVPVRWKGRLVF